MCRQRSLNNCVVGGCQFYFHFCGSSPSTPEVSCAIDALLSLLKNTVSTILLVLPLMCCLARATCRSVVIVILVLVLYDVRSSNIVVLAFSLCAGVQIGAIGYDTAPGIQRLAELATYSYFFSSNAGGAKIGLRSMLLLLLPAPPLLPLISTPDAMTLMCSI